MAPEALVFTSAVMGVGEGKHRKREKSTGWKPQKARRAYLRREPLQRGESKETGEDRERNSVKAFQSLLRGSREKYKKNDGSGGIDASGCQWGKRRALSV